MLLYNVIKNVALKYFRPGMAVECVEEWGFGDYLISVGELFTVSAKKANVDGCLRLHDKELYVFPAHLFKITKEE